MSDAGAVTFPTRIAKATGPTLWSELEAAGLQGVPISVMPDAVEVASSVDAKTVQAVKAVVAAHDPAKIAPAAVPDNPTLGDWRVALTLWGRIDDVTAKVAALVSSDKPDQQRIGKIASERLNYSNNVLRSQLLQLKDAFGFTADDVDESLWRAQRVSVGDLSGTWPLPASN